MEPTTIDMLIARIETHPEEFFKMNWDIAEFATTDSTKWDLILKNMTCKAPCFTQEEIERFKTALLAKIRENVDVEVMKTVMTNSDTFNPKIREYKDQLKKLQAQSAYQQQMYVAAAQNNTLATQGYQSVIMGVQTGPTVSSSSFTLSSSTQPTAPKRSLLQRLFNDPI